MSLKVDSLGVEIELADVPRSLVLPPEIGEWDFCERDIVNTLYPYRGVAADPLGVRPPVGGEVHVPPGRTVAEAVHNVQKLFEWLGAQGAPYTASPSSPLHVHVRVKGLRDDLAALKRLVAYLKRHQHYLIERVWAYKKEPRMSRFNAYYLRNDGGKPMPDWMADNILEKAESFEDLMRLHCRGKDGETKIRPSRYCVNLYTLGKIDTIEVRLFHATVDIKQIEECVIFSKLLIEDAISEEMEVVPELLRCCEFNFPPFVYDHELMEGWEATRHPQSRAAKKVRKLIDI